MHMSQWLVHDAHEKVRRQLVGTGSLPPPFEFLELGFRTLIISLDSKHH